MNPALKSLETFFSQVHPLPFDILQIDRIGGLQRKRTGHRFLEKREDILRYLSLSVILALAWASVIKDLKINEGWQEQRKSSQETVDQQ